MNIKNISETITINIIKIKLLKEVDVDMDINKELIEYCKENDFPINDMDINDFKKVEKL